MKLEFTAKSNTFGELPIETTIEHNNKFDFNVRSQIEIKGEQFRIGLVHFQGTPCVELTMSAYEKLTGKKKPSGRICIRLDRDFMNELKEMQETAKKLSEQSEIDYIENLKKEGRAVYVLSRGGDSWKWSVGIGEEISNEGYRKGVRAFARYENIDINSEPKMELNGLGGDFALGGFYGDVWILTEEQFNQIVKSDKEQVKIEKIEKMATLPRAQAAVAEWDAEEDEEWNDDQNFWSPQNPFFNKKSKAAPQFDEFDRENLAE